MQICQNNFIYVERGTKSVLLCKFCKLVLLSGGNFKTNLSTQYNICKSGNLVDKWSDYCTIT